jgi:hypothetical protein
VIRSVKVHPAARAETRAAVLWYEGQREGLGWEFLWTVDDTIQRVAGRRIPSQPSDYADLDPALRRTILDRFPSTIYFLEEKDALIIIAVAHQKRRPGYWRRRSIRKVR